MADSNKPSFIKVVGGADPSGSPRTSDGAPASQFIGKRVRTHTPQTITPVVWKEPEADLWNVGLYYEEWTEGDGSYLQVPPKRIDLRFLETYDDFTRAALKANELGQGKVYSQLVAIGLESKQVASTAAEVPFTPPAYGGRKPKLQLVVR